MFDYFIYYTFTETLNSGDGNVDVKLSRPISSIAEVRSVEKGLMEEFGHDSVVICSFVLFESV